jgi:malonyl CoA-acyl carrier protein transacylase
MQKVWVIKMNGQQHEENFIDAQEAINYCKQSSLRSLCCIRNQGNKAIIYENGEVAGAHRTKELRQHVIEIIERENEHYHKQTRGKASRKKQG